MSATECPRCQTPWDQPQRTADFCMAVADGATVMQRRIAELTAALAPFADLANQVAREAITSPTDATSGLLTINYGDLRRASEALAK